MELVDSPLHKRQLYETQSSRLTREMSVRTLLLSKNIVHMIYACVLHIIIHFIVKFTFQISFEFQV